MNHVVVVGGGVSGLVAAYRLRRRLGPGARITLVEQARRLGGKLRTVEVGGVASDVGAEAFVLRNPAAVELVAELGLGDALIHPGPASATVHAAARTVALPKRTFLGVPADAGEVRGVLSSEGAARVAAEASLPPLEVPADGDLAVGEVLAERFGRELVDRLVEPLLGGVYAGRADLLGLRATMPALVAALDSAGGSLTAAAARVLGLSARDVAGGSPAGAGRALGSSARGDVEGSLTDAATLSPSARGDAEGSSTGAGRVLGSSAQDVAGDSLTDAAALSPSVRGDVGGSRLVVGDQGPGRRPVFGTLRGGMGVLVDELVRQARPEVRLGYPVRQLRRGDDGWWLEIGGPGRAEVLRADAVVLAVPPPAARRLLADVVPAAAAGYADIEVGSMAVATMVFPDDVPLPDTSGVLLAVGQRHTDGTPFTAKAFTHTSVKWGGGGPVRLRASIGRVGETELLRRDDEDLLDAVRADLRELTGVDTRPVDWRITRWGGGLPQYGVGHIAAVGAIERAVAEVPGLAVAGAAFRGVGIPACIETATAAAERVAKHLPTHTDAG